MIHYFMYDNLSLYIYLYIYSFQFTIFIVLKNQWSQNLFNILRIRHLHKGILYYYIAVKKKVIKSTFEVESLLDVHP